MRSSYPTHPIQDQTAQTISATSYCKQKRVKSNIGSTPAPREPKALFEGIGHCIRGRTTCASSYNFPTGCYLAGGVSEFSANKRGHFEISYEQPTDNELLAVKLSVGSNVFFFHRPTADEGACRCTVKGRSRLLRHCSNALPHSYNQA